MDLSKIGKALGKASNKIDDIGGSIKRFNDDAKTGAKWMDKTFFDKGAQKNGDSVSQALMGEHARRLKKPIVATGIAGMAAVGFGGSSVGSRNMAKMGGRIDAGQGLSNMTDTVKLSPGIQKMQNGKNVKFNNSLDNAGADGSIVFAMHNMR